MKRLSKQMLATLLALALAGTLMAGLAWVVATTQGTRWLLTSAVPLSGVGLTAQKIEGRLIDHLLLTGTRLELGQRNVEIDRLELRWKPLLLLGGSVAVQELTLQGLRIQDDTPRDNKPPTLAWPRVSQFEQLFDARIARLRATDLVYRRLQEQALLVTSISGSLTWQDSLLSFDDLTLQSTSGQISGSVAAGFKQASLTADLAVALTQPIAGMDHISLLVRRGKGRAPEALVGTITLTGSAGARKLLELTGDLGLAPDAVNLRRLTLSTTGQKGRITADGALRFTAVEPLLTLQVKTVGLDLAPQLHLPTDISGSLRFAGSLNNYRGDFSFANRARGWQAASVRASYQGTRSGVKLTSMMGKLLDGSLTGNMELNWLHGFAMQALLSGRDLNPARVDPAWQGLVNFNATGSLARTGQAPFTGNLSASLLESRLHGQTLTGELHADLSGTNVSLARLALKGNGFDLHASGQLNRRITLAANISDFSRLVPGSAGTLQADGWLRWREGQLSGDISGTGKRLAYAGAQAAAADLTARLAEGQAHPLHVTASLRDVVYKGSTVDAVALAADGTLLRHDLNIAVRSGGGDARLTLAAGYTDGIWKGEITRLAGRDSHGPWRLTAPARFALGAEKAFLAPLFLAAAGAERLEVAAELALKPLSGQVRATWSALNLARANSYLKDTQIKGSSSGTARIGFQSGTMTSLAGKATTSGTVTRQGSTLNIRQSTLSLDGNAEGLRAGIDLTAADGATVKASYASSAPLRLAVPEQGTITAELNGIELALFKAWLPANTRLEGRISAHAKGALLPGKRFELEGSSAISGGVLHRQGTEGELKLSFTSATTAWEWRGEALAGTLAMAMAEYGQAKGTFQLPLAARFPLAVNAKGPLRGTLIGQLHEKGIITTLFPGLVRESSGELDADLAVNGSWSAPQLTGTMRLSKASAYLPTAGIHLKDVQLTARLEKNLVRIDSFRARSGPGHLEGTALISLAGWRVTNYKGTLSGDTFQTVHFPELQLLSTPKLTFEGTPQKLTLRGELQLPELKIIGSKSHTVVRPSSDVIREGVVAPVAKSSPLALDVQVRVLLGDKVFVKVAGIDAQLGGGMDLSLSRLDKITSKGEVKVIKGNYRTYGVNLEIVRGRLFFAGGSIDRPSIDVLALRTIGNIRAGVTVSGTLQRPVTKLYSEPAMPDVDVLAYIVLGRPLGSNSQQASLLNQAASALLTSSQAVVLQEQIKSYLGLSTLEVQKGVGPTSGAMGYKPLQVTAPGTIPAAQQAGITETVLTVGKYLTPQLYISYGKSLFTGSNLFRLRYDLFKHWQIETQTGSGESGADLYYKLEFM